MKEGTPISTALASCGISDVVAESMLNVAERSGALSEMLDRIADYYERSLQRNIDLTTRLIEPLLMIVFGAVIGGIVGYFALEKALVVLPFAVAVAASSLLYVAVADLIPGLHRKIDPRSSITQVLLIGLGIALIAFAERQAH